MASWLECFIAGPVLSLHHLLVDVGQQSGVAQMWRCGSCGYVNLDGGRCVMCNAPSTNAVESRAVLRGPAAPHAATAVEPVTSGRAAFYAPPAVVLVVLATIVGNDLYQHGLVHLLDGRTRTVALLAALLSGFLFYVVNWVVASEVAVRVRLSPRTGDHPAKSVLMGVLVGGGLAISGALVVSSSQGHASLDPTAALLVDDGGWIAFGIGVAVIAIVAPLVEEYVFRGLLAESLAPFNRRLALYVSAAGFAAAHLSPIRFPYYLVMGLVFGSLYLRHGIWASITAHAVFNGAVLLTAAIVLSIGPTTVTANGLSVTLPTGWHAIAHPVLDDFAAAGPDDAVVEIAHASAPTGTAVNANDIVRSIQAGRTLGDTTVMGATATTRVTLAGYTVVADLGSTHEAGALAVILSGSTVHIIVVHQRPGTDPHPTLNQILDTARAA